MKNLYEMPHTTMQEVGLKNQAVQQFIAEYDGDVFFRRINFALSKKSKSLNDILYQIKGTLTEAHMAMPHNDRTVVITGKRDGKDFMIWLDVQTFSEAYKFEVDFLGAPESVDTVANEVSLRFHSDKMPVIKWWFMGRHGEETKDFYLPPETNKILPEYYPDLGEPTKYLDEYMQSDESILLMAGPPGTGKTTLLRYLVNRYKMTAHVIYDEEIMKKDGVFQSYLFGDGGGGRPTPAQHMDDFYEEEGSDIMIVEDADTILLSREDDGNKLMSRFLNVADGLIKLPNKKLVFTTNLTDFSKVDQALLRPGRCFGVMHTRLMNLTEAQAAAKAANMPVPMEKRDYSLAEIFNQGKRQTIRRMGFGVRH